MKLDKNFQSVSLFPDCVRIRPFKKVVLNSLGLSGPGADVLFKRDLWQKMRDPFLISFMAIGETKEKRVREAEEFARIFSRELPSFSSRVGLELNISCPNASHDPLNLINDAVDQLRRFAGLGIPVILKVNALTPVDAIASIVDSGMCDAVTVSNTIPWGQMPDKINWRKLFGSDESPLKHLGGGGLSGYPLLLIVAEWVTKVREKGIEIPIIAGGGIMGKEDVELMFKCRADAIFIGTVAMLRPWRVPGIIQRGIEIFGGKYERD